MQCQSVAYPAENISISGNKWAVFVCSFCCKPSIIDADNNELPPIRIFFVLFASDENDFTNLEMKIGNNEISEIVKSDSKMKMVLPLWCNIARPTSTRIEKICVISWIIFG